MSHQEIAVLTACRTMLPFHIKTAVIAKILVNFAVTVIVQTVTNLGRRRLPKTHHPLSARAHFFARARPKFVGNHTWSPVQRFVHKPVAVVIHAIAHFFRRFRRAAVFPFQSGSTRLYSATSAKRIAALTPAHLSHARGITRTPSRYRKTLTPRKPMFPGHIAAHIPLRTSLKRTVHRTIPPVPNRKAPVCISCPACLVSGARHAQLLLKKRTQGNPSLPVRVLYGHAGPSIRTSLVAQPRTKVSLRIRHTVGALALQMLFAPFAEAFVRIISHRTICPTRYVTSHARRQYGKYPNPLRPVHDTSMQRMRSHVSFYHTMPHPATTDPHIYKNPGTEKKQGSDFPASEINAMQSRRNDDYFATHAPLRHTASSPHSQLRRHSAHILEMQISPSPQSES